MLFAPRQRSRERWGKSDRYTVRLRRNQRFPLTLVLSLGGERKCPAHPIPRENNLLSPWGRGQGEGCGSKSLRAAKTFGSSSTAAGSTAGMPALQICGHQ